MESSRSSRSSSPAEERRLISSWQPEPLVPDLRDDQLLSIQRPHVITSKPGHLIEVDGRPCLNAGTHNYLGLADSPRLVEASLNAVRKYGVGSCGPRAFYGTMDVHLKLEEAISSFLRVEETVLYSFGFSTIASAIPAYAKAADTVLFDEQCNFAIQKGITASRSRAIKFKHNSADDLRAKLRQLTEENSKRQGKRKELRLFLMIESVYAKTGTLCPLKQLVEVAKDYKMRVFIDESRSFGVLGATGRGITEHLNVPLQDIDLIMVSLENALCSFGGFCAGTRFIIDHQRLAGSGYCFSASLPPFQCCAALEALKMVEEDPALVQKAQQLFAYANEKLNRLTHLKNLSHALSPIKILVLRKGGEQGEGDDIDGHGYCRTDARILDEICRDILDKEQIAISAPVYLEDDEATSPLASIRLIVNAGLGNVGVDRIFCALERFSREKLT